MTDQLTHTPSCRRCGACCQKGGPALHVQDLPLFADRDGLDLSLVVTLRAGEPVLDQVRGQVLPLAAEMLKLHGPNGGVQGGMWTCPLYDAAQNACGLYERRPAECRALNCQDTSALAEMYEADRLSRRDLLPQGHAVLAVIAEHEALVPVERIAPLGRALRAGGQAGLDAADELVRMALADQAFRTGLAQRAGIAPEYHDFFLGRCAETLFAAAGIALRADARLGYRAQSDPLWRE